MQTGNDSGQIQVQQVFTQIKRCVSEGKFVEAEALRRELMDLDTMALKEIIASAEIIEAARSEALDKDHLALWKALYETLSSEEANCFYYALQEKLLPAGTLLMRQGKLNDRLLFVEQGKLAAVFRKGGENHLVLQVGKGGFAGEETFFGMSVCTSSVVAQSEVRVKYLERSSLPDIAEQCPGLYEKLQAFCRNFGQYEAAFERKRQEKSRFERLPAHGRVNANLLTAAMKQTGKRFNADIGDISRGGTCFFIKASKKEAARQLLSRPLQMVFALQGKDEQPVEFVAMGRVVKVKFQLETDYSVHVQFAKPLDEEKLETLQKTNA